jgi:2-polyprenyl-3-methyl-5-hydroxy-6-metoxy-1,4-benzoquinol methylase
MIRNCIYCQSSTKRFLSQKNTTQILQKISRCVYCDTIFPEKSMSVEESKNYIHDEVYDINKYNDKLFNDSINKDFFVINKIKKYFREGENALDVGAHIGGFVHNLKKIGYDSYGIDIYKDATDFAKKKGLNIFESQFTEYLPQIIESKSFSLITFMESIYYFEDPKTVLLKAKSLLEKNGLLIIQTINGDSTYFNNRTFFSRYGDNVQFIPTFKSINYWLKDLSFTVLETTALPRFKINKLLKYNRSFKSVVRNFGLFLNRLDYFNKNPIRSSDKLIIIARKN